MNISDKEAVELLGKRVAKTSRRADVFVPRTIVSPVVVRGENGSEEIEFRPYVRMYEYTTEKRWQKALELEKTYKELNSLYIKSLEENGLPTTAKERANPLGLTYFDRV